MSRANLISVEIQSLEEANPLVADLPFFSICSASLIIPSVFSIGLLVIGTRIPPAIDQVSQVPNLSNTSNVTITSELDHLNPVHQAVSLSLEFSEPLSFPLPTFLVISLYGWRTNKPLRELEAILPNLSIGTTKAHFFKASLVNYTRLKATLSLPYPAPSATLVWEHGTTIGFDFVMTVKLIAALLLIPIIFSITQKISQRSIVRFSIEQKLTVLLIVIIFLSDLGSVLLGLFAPSTLKLPCTEILEDIVVAYIGFYSLSLFASFLRPDAHGRVVYVGPYFMMVFSGTYLIARDVREISNQTYEFFPQQSLRPEISLWSLALVFFYGLGLVASAAVGSLEVPESREIRFRHYISESLLIVLCATGYILAGNWGWVNTALFDVLPPVGFLMYAAVMFHGQQDTQKGAGFPAEKIPATTAETAIGADPIDA
jgi:hypothetical protein